jgi:TPR repeat protein
MKIDMTTNHLSNERDLIRACKYWDRGDLRQAFNLLLSLSEHGYAASMLNLGYFYDRGLAVQRNEAKALYWYRRAYAHGDASGANNIGTIYRDRGDFTRAVQWFSRAIKAGEDGSALEIAKIYLRQGKHSSRVKTYLKRVSESNNVNEADQEEAKRLLMELSLPRRSEDSKNVASRVKTRDSNHRVRR